MSYLSDEGLGSGAVTTSELTDGEQDEYLAFLNAVDDSLVYYSPQYRRLLENLLDCGSRYWIARENGAITGVLPTMWKEGRYGRVVNSLPFYGSTGGVLACTPAAEAALVERFNESAAEAVAATWVCHPLRQSPGCIAHDLEDERIGQFTSLECTAAPENELLARLESSARRNIRKAEAGGVTVRVDNDRLDFLEEVHRENMAQIGGRAKEHAFFAKLPASLKAGRDFRLYIAERDGKSVAALLLLYFNRTVEYFTPATVESERHSQPSALIIWRAMLDAIEAGYKRWNWGGTWLSQEGVWRFKRKWGAQDYPYRYYVKVNSKALMTRQRSELLSGYGDFYVVPYDRLSKGPVS